VWDEYLDSWEEIIDLRRRYYEPLLPEIDKKFRALDSQIRLRLEQRQRLDDSLQHLLIAPRPEFLATADERILGMQLAQLEAQHKNDTSPAGEDARRRIERLQGRIHFDIHTTYDQRLTDAYKHLRELDADVARLKEIYAAFVRTRQAATQSYQGYDDQIRHARNRSRDAKETVATLMARQGRMLEMMAVNELEQRRNRLDEYQIQARFAMAESYDRAVKAQQQGAGSAAQ
jgi:chromosome segregation ATPase